MTTKTVTALVLDYMSTFTNQAMKYSSGGIQVAGLTVIVTIVLELLSLDTVQRLLKQRDGKSLYGQAVLANLVNHWLLGVPIYMIAAALFCLPDHSQTPLQRIPSTIGLMVVHAILYYLIHKAFHDRPRLYQSIHRFHHRFHTHVPPVAANAVTLTEYLVAYVLPFVPALVLVPSDPTSLQYATAIISILNLLVHFPKLEMWSEKYWPRWLVSPHDHLEHHRKLSVHYASPTLNVDYLVDGIHQVVLYNKSPRQQ